MITQLPAGMLAERIGGKITLGFGVLLPTLCTLLIPLAAREGGATGLIIVRFVMGLGQVCSYLRHIIQNISLAVANPVIL